MTMKLLLIALALTSLLTAAASPSPSEVIVKEGHRVVAVEYANEPDGVTKVSISPPDTNDVVSNPMFSGPRDLVCDAYGKCKHKVANAIGKTKDMVTKTGHGESVPEKTTGHTVGESVARGIGKAKELAGDVKAVVEDGASKEFDVVDSPKRLVEDIARNVSGKVQDNANGTVDDVLSTLKGVVYDVVWYVLCRDKMGSVVGLVHMVGFSTAYGMCVWVTSVSSYVLGRCLPRRMFGMVQSRIYPVYFKAMACCVCGALLGHLVGQKDEVLTNRMGMFQSLSLGSALLMVLTNMILLEPQATKAVYERMKIEKEEGRGVGVAVATKDGVVDGRGPTVVRSAANAVVERRDVLRLNEKLKRLNAYSSALNSFTLVALTWHMAYLSQRLK